MSGFYIPMRGDMHFTKFSIVIPAHDEEKYIEKTLKYALSQKYPKNKYEVIVVENGSKDKTLSKIKEIRSKIR